MRPTEPASYPHTDRTPRSRTTCRVRLPSHTTYVRRHRKIPMTLDPSGTSICALPTTLLSCGPIVVLAAADLTGGTRVELVICVITSVPSSAATAAVHQRTIPIPTQSTNCPASRNAYPIRIASSFSPHRNERSGSLPDEIDARGPDRQGGERHLRISVHGLAESVNVGAILASNLLLSDDLLTDGNSGNGCSA